ncbi:MAG: cyclic nucleotide-binding/CBS domain-containing protein [Nitrospinales bacterium]
MDEIRYYMNESLIAIDSEATAREAAKMMNEQRVKSLLIDEKGKYVGIVTPSDITFKITAEGLDPDKTKVSQIMAKPLITLESDLTMARAFLHMHKNHVRHIIVTEEKKIVGVISLNDFVAYYANKLGQKKDSDNS